MPADKACLLPEMPPCRFLQSNYIYEYKWIFLALPSPHYCVFKRKPCISFNDSSLVYFGSHHAIFHSLELAFVFPSGVLSFSQHIFSGLLLSTELSAGFLSMTDAILCLPKSTLCFIYWVNVYWGVFFFFTFKKMLRWCPPKR